MANRKKNKTKAKKPRKPKDKPPNFFLDVDLPPETEKRIKYYIKFMRDNPNEHFVQSYSGGELITILRQKDRLHITLARQIAERQFFPTEVI